MLQYMDAEHLQHKTHRYLTIAIYNEAATCVEYPWSDKSNMMNPQEALQRTDAAKDGDGLSTLASAATTNQL
ncbi:uncharacterized protein PHALS_13106 [Plasmopara halstedii]|uniref:Uncharacterized protein n=1 Tax=Plasmopara halstedii TaxID=4781 RepID=A0A0P1AN80_PLAHL|nr:uncharacterized protein PHALS_13106 [Plasmopara halstedii]CEG42869.1 hypothetical protein PHALS_13106 [Plasmopara halstedii]|eukprot:XP_024579238.1 hypothetical protein PHALS_13106 [Plasmopara halstedii]